MFEVRHPWLRPLWARLLVTGVVVAWALAEVALGNLVWAAVFGAAGALLVWKFFVAFDPEHPDWTRR